MKETQKVNADMRGRDAMAKVRAEKDLSDLNSQMAQIFRRDGEQRIKKGKKDPPYKPLQQDKI